MVTDMSDTKKLFPHCLIFIVCLTVTGCTIESSLPSSWPRPLFTQGVVVNPVHTYNLDTLDDEGIDGVVRINFRLLKDFHPTDIQLETAYPNAKAVKQIMTTVSHWKFLPAPGTPRRYSYDVYYGPHAWPKRYASYCAAYDERIIRMRSIGYRVTYIPSCLIQTAASDDKKCSYKIYRMWPVYPAADRHNKTVSFLVKFNLNKYGFPQQIHIENENSQPPIFSILAKAALQQWYFQTSSPDCYKDAEFELWFVFGSPPNYNS